MSQPKQIPTDLEILKCKDIQQLNEWHNEYSKQYRNVLNCIKKHEDSEGEEDDYQVFPYLRALTKKSELQEKLELILSRKSELEIIEKYKQLHHEEKG